MRIIGGIKGGLKIPNTNNLNIRPSKSISKEALFNILNNKITFSEVKALDLFSGTGAISYELASRGVPSVTAVDISLNCINFIVSTSKNLDLNDRIFAIKTNAMQFIKNSQESYDLIFADPPYNFNKYPSLIDIILNNGILSKKGILVVEHEYTISLENVSRFNFKRKYGKSAFSFFSYDQA